MIFKSRDEVWPGAIPRNSTGTVRPLMAPDRPLLAIHYTGAGLWLDPNDTPTELKAIQAYAQQANKPWEYNYVIDGQGVVWEYAGEYRAAHAGLTNNNDAYGVLLLVGLANNAMLTGFEVVPEPMILACRELRAALVDKGALAVDHEMRPHKEMPFAQTICPGPEVMKRWESLTTPYVPVPPPVPGKEVSVFIGFFRNGPAVFAAYTGGYRTWVQNEAVLEVMVALADLAGYDSATHVVDAIVLEALGPILGPVP